MTVPTARATTALLTALSALGLLCTRLGVFDDGALMLGARLARMGKLPYLDFHTLYGPLGYTLLGELLGAAKNPGLALRLGQSLMLATLAVLAHLVARAFSGPRGEVWAPLAVLALSAAIGSPPFLGFGLSLVSLMLYLLAAPGAGTDRPNVGVALAGGLALALAGLVRPAFVVDVAAALLAFEAVLAAARGPRRVRIAAIFVSAAVAATTLLWIGLYRRIPVPTAWEATFRMPGRMFADRYLEAGFLEGPLFFALAAGAALFLSASLWALALPGARVALGSCVLIGALFPLSLRFSSHPARDAALVALGLFLALLFLVFRERARLAADRLLETAALFSLAALAYGNYFWIRADRQHLLPMLGLASLGGVLILPRLRRTAQIGCLGLLLFDFLVLARQSGEAPFPIVSLWRGGVPNVLANARRPGAGWKTVWPAGEVPSHAIAAVSLADAGADGSSRFVAVASSHAETFGNPVYLFLLSRRLPYTKWYAYDPGVQSSPAVQRLMARELDASGSRTAIVWRAEQFHFGRLPPTGDRITPFDSYFQRLYPRVLARFGNYEVRSRL
jgi:hypothetical protein